MKKVSSNILFLLGGLAVALSFLPYLFWGQDSIFIYHDQLDGELIAYLLHARHLGETGPFPEFMGGAARTALTVPAPMFVLLYTIMDAHLALASMQLLGSLVGYMGMCLLVRELWKYISLDRISGVQEPSDTWENMGWVETLVTVFISVLFAYLPFLPVYGLSQYGLPLLVYSVLRICGAKKSGCPCRMSSWKGIIRNFLPWMYVILYGLGSSLVLCGFGVLAVGAVAGLWMQVMHLTTSHGGKKAEPIAKTRGKEAGRVLLATGLLLMTYIIENIPLLQQMLLGQGVVSHKEEYVLHGAKFLLAFVENFVSGKVHTNDFHSLFLIGSVVAFLMFLLTKKNGKLVKLMSLLMGIILSIALLSALWDCHMGVALREKLGSLGSFQLNRLLWMTPMLWYLLLALSLLGMVSLLRESWTNLQGAEPRKKTVSGVLLCVLAAMTLFTGVNVLWNSHLKPNAIKAVNGKYDAISFSDYLALGVMEQVEVYLQETTGKEKDEYRVVSFGIDPAAALYHGFYCLDGYSNNYDVAYKQAFRKVIAPELARNDYIRQNFDDWGNRCYLFSSECPGYYTIEKGGFYLKDYQIDTQALMDIAGVDCYLFSAVYIENAESQGLALMRELPFETEESYYRIFLYQVVSDNSGI